ncbi:hypothetical protein ACWV95_22725 [Streptomyces albus]
MTVRNRQWTVAEVTRSSIAAADPVRAVSNAAAPPPGHPGFHRGRRA